MVDTQELSEKKKDKFKNDYYYQISWWYCNGETEDRDVDTFDKRSVSLLTSVDEQIRELDKKPKVYNIKVYQCKRIR